MSDPTILKAALCCLSKTREDLQRPIITPDGTLVATDGSRMLVYPEFVPTGRARGYVPLLHLPLTLHMGPASSTPFNPGTASAIYFDFSKLEPSTEKQPLLYKLYFARRLAKSGIIHASYGEQFPDWKHVVSTFNNTAQDQSCFHHFNPLFITDVQKALKAKFVDLHTYEGKRYIATFPMPSTASTLKLYFLGYSQ